jgi:hypothetical protein
MGAAVGRFLCCGTLWEQSLLAIDCAAVVNRLARFYLETRGA